MKDLKIVVLTGAGVSAESGVPTFRDANGLWEGHRFEDVATPEAWSRDPELVLEFYNQRRRAARQVKPNAAHLALADLENEFDVHIITQNIDNLHEQAGSTKVLHLHGELFKSRSTNNQKLLYELGDKDINMGDLCEKGSQLRPHVVWFGEAVPAMEPAIAITSQADVLMVVGTSLQVYPAASLLHYAPGHAKLFLVDPKIPEHIREQDITIIEEAATTGVPKAISKIKSLFG
jgi:NAD-dependent deacetylase